MTLSEAREFVRRLAEDYFGGYNVIFSNQSRVPKPGIPLVVLSVGPVKRPQAPINVDTDEGYIVGVYGTTFPITVDLFTNGTPVIDEDGQTVAYEDSSIDELTGFVDYINGPEGVDVCTANDVSLLVQNDIQNLTGLINDTNYEYRSRVDITVSFTHETKPAKNIGWFSKAEISEVPKENNP